MVGWSSYILVASLSIGAEPTGGGVVSTHPRPGGSASLGGGGARATPAEGCVTAHESRLLDPLMNLALAQARDSTTGSIPETPRRISFYPLGGNLWGDLYTVHFLDLDYTPVIVDFMCSTHTYNNHNGVDTDIRSFGEQMIGIPVFAALDGTVLVAHDGEPDQNTACFPVANNIRIDHGAGRIGFYHHLRLNSLLVGVGDTVRAGQQIALAGSSGCSPWPHLHFQVVDNSQVRETFAGPCRPGPSLWDEQPVVRFDTYLSDAGITEFDLSYHPGLPHIMPRTGHIAVDDPFFNVWFIVHNLPSGSVSTWEFLRPDGTVAYSETVPWNNVSALRKSWWWFTFYVDEMHQIVGPWTVRLRINGQVEAELPLQVLPQRVTSFNQAPLAVTVTLDPPAPFNDEAVFARVQSDLVVDDLDYDMLAYHYVWEVNGEVVRDIVSAGQADATPRLLAPAGSLLRCTVTPSDGFADGPSTQVSVIVRAACRGDCNASGSVDILDIIALIGQWEGESTCDTDNNGIADLNDLLNMLSTWGPCPQPQ